MHPMKFEEELALNRTAYEQMKDRLLQDYRGQYVVIAHGRLSAVAPTFEEATAAVDQIQPAPEHVAVFPAGEEPLMEPYYSYIVEYTKP
jgi:hypothetical protein